MGYLQHAMVTLFIFSVSAWFSSSIAGRAVAASSAFWHGGGGRTVLENKGYFKEIKLGKGKNKKVKTLKINYIVI